MTAFVFSLFIVKQCDEMLDLLRNSAKVCCQCLQRNAVCKVESRAFMLLLDTEIKWKMTKLTLFRI